jgi:hypothetical protein
MLVSMAAAVPYEVPVSIATATVAQAGCGRGSSPCQRGRGSLAGIIEVESTMECPSTAQVQDALWPLLSGLQRLSTPDRAVIRSVSAGTLRVHLFRNDGTPIIERNLEGSESCTGLARAVAVIISAWEVEYQPDLYFPNRIALESPPPDSNAIRPEPPARQATRTWEFAAGASSSWAGSKLALGGTADATFFAWSRIGVRLGLFGHSPRELSLGEADASWWRLGLAAGPVLRLGSGPLTWDLHAQFLSGWLFARGTHFDVDHSASGFGPGLGAGARFSYHWGQLAPWIGLNEDVWLIRQDLVVQAAEGERRQLPRLETRVGVGLRLEL